MKIIILTFLIIFSFLNVLHSQNEKVFIGKKGNVIWDKKISSSNLNSMFTYYYPIYYKTTENKNFQKVGIWGNKLESHLNLNIPHVNEEFKKYKRNKELSYLLLGGTVTFISSWTYSSLNYMENTGDYRMRAFFKPQQLPHLVGYFACFYGSIHLNLKGDKNLRNAVFEHNKFLSN